MKKNPNPDPKNELINLKIQRKFLRDIVTELAANLDDVLHNPARASKKTFIKLFGKVDQVLRKTQLVARLPSASTPASTVPITAGCRSVTCGPGSP